MSRNATLPAYFAGHSPNVDQESGMFLLDFDHARFALTPAAMLELIRRATAAYNSFAVADVVRLPVKQVRSKKGARR